MRSERALGFSATLHRGDAEKQALSARVAGQNPGKISAALREDSLRLGSHATIHADGVTLALQSIFQPLRLMGDSSGPC